MTSHAAVAAAIRQRLLEGRPAPLRGLGTLVRQHVASRVEERPDGSRVLLPPGETIGLARTVDDRESLALAYARFRGIEDADAERAYDGAMDQIEARLSATGEARLPGVGLLRRTSGGIVLGVEADLLQAVNRTYEGLPPVETHPAVERAPAPPTVPLFTSTPRPPSPSDGPAGPPSVEVVPPSDDEGPSAPMTRPDGDVASPRTSAPESPPEDAAADSFPSMPFASPHRPPAPPDAAPAAPTAAAFADDEPPSLDAVESFADMHDEVGDRSLDQDIDDLLSENAADAMPGPFGGPTGSRLSDLLPPPTAPAAEDSPIDDWGEETWTAPAFDDASLHAPDDDLGLDLEPFEEADYDVVPAAPLAPEPADPFAQDATGVDPVAPPAPPPSDPPDVVYATVVGPEAGVEVEAGAPMAPETPGTPRPDPTLQAVAEPAPGPVPSPSAETTGEPGEAEDAGRSAFWLWALFVVLLLGVVAAAAVWFWPEIERRIWPRLNSAPTEQAPPSDAGPLTVQAATPGDAPIPDSTLAADGRELLPLSAGGTPAPVPTELPSEPAAGPAGTPASAPSEATPPASPTGQRLGVAPPIGQALTPPVLAGLDATDRASLSGRAPVDPDARAWTLVVLSTPSRADAEALHLRYRRSGYRASVLATRTGGRAMYRVAIGQFASRADAIRLRDRLPPQAPPDTWALDLQTL